jgi:adenine-specific DNA-methyltransferase
LQDNEIIDGEFKNDLKLRANFIWEQDTLKNELNSNTRIIIKSLSLAPRYDKENYEAAVPANIIDERHGAKTNDYEKNRYNDLGFTINFDYPKPISYLQYIFGFNSNQNSIFLDYFSGTGSSHHAIQLLNRQGGNRKSFLVEQGEYFKRIIIKRKKKIAYTFDWKDGKPKNGR